MNQMAPSVERRILAVLTLATALAGAFLGLFYRVGTPVAAMALTFSSGAFYIAGWSTWWARSPREGAGAEVAALRGAGRRIVREARFGAVGMFLSAVVLLRCAPHLFGIQSCEILLVAIIALILSLHGYSKAYPAFDLPTPEPWIESLPAAETPAPEPEPGLQRLQTIKDQLQDRGYR